MDVSRKTSWRMNRTWHWHCFFFCFKDTHTHAHHLVVSSSSSLGLLCFLFFGLGNGMSHHAFERGVEVTFVLSQAGERERGIGCK